MIAEPPSPEYFLDSFPRDAFPQFQWTARPPHLPQAAWTTETTHRDGQQGGLPLTTAKACTFTISYAASLAPVVSSGKPNFSSTILQTVRHSPAR